MRPRRLVDGDPFALLERADYQSIECWLVQDVSHVCASGSRATLDAFIYSPRDTGL